ncbi:hypothetical protein [Arcticibacter svalbardensis]|nr:hypothetical protein [Arcticibacter svalbardensis]
MSNIEATELFKGYKERLIHCCSIERFEEVYVGSHYMLDTEFKDLNKEIFKTIKQNSGVEIMATLKEFKDYVHYQHIVNFNSPNKYGKKSAEKYLKLYNLLVDYIKEADADAVPVVNVNQVKTFKKPKLSEYNKPSVNSKQVLILMKYFRENNLTNKEITDTALAECFGTLTGYSGDQLRKDFVSFNKEEILFKSDELDTLKAIFIKMSKDLSKLQLK